MGHAGVKCSYLEGTNESLRDGVLGIEHLYLHHLVKHNVRMLVEVVVQHLECECTGRVQGRKKRQTGLRDILAMSTGTIKIPNVIDDTEIRYIHHRMARVLFRAHVTCYFQRVLPILTSHTSANISTTPNSKLNTIFP